MVKPPHVTTKEVLLRAAELIEEYGWIRHRLRTVYGYCAVGAITVAATEAYIKDGYGHSQQAIRKLAETIEPELAQLAGKYRHRGLVEEWNDGQFVLGGKRRVVAGLRKAAEKS